MTAYRIVPVEPTQEMLNSGYTNNPTAFTDDTDRGFQRDVANDVFVAMIRSAPSAADDPEVVEMVARAMERHANNSRGTWDLVLAEESKAGWRDLARAALKAMEG